MTRAVRCLSRLADDRGGATAVEYGLIAALICLAAVGGMHSFADSLTGMWDYVQGEVTNAT